MIETDLGRYALKIVAYLGIYGQNMHSTWSGGDSVAWKKKWKAMDK